MQALYDQETVRPMWEELQNIGIRPVKTADEVDEALRNKGTTLMVINSVCGCAAGHARPGIGLALQHRVIPDYLVTVFAGVDREATQRAREYMPDTSPSSPSVALFRDGKLAYVLQRSQIEVIDAEGVSRNLIRVFDYYCSAGGPSVPKEIFEKNFATVRWSSMIPRSRGN